MGERTHRNGTGRGGENAAHYLMAAVLRADPSQTVEQALAALRGRHYDTVEILCVVDAEDKLAT